MNAGKEELTFLGGKKMSGLRKRLYSDEALVEILPLIASKKFSGIWGKTNRFWCDSVDFSLPGLVILADVVADVSIQDEGVILSEKYVTHDYLFLAQIPVVWWPQTPKPEGSDGREESNGGY